MRLSSNGKKNRKKKRKKSNDSVGSSGDLKAGRYTRSPEGVSVISVLSQTNSVLFEDSSDINIQSTFESDPDAEVESDHSSASSCSNSSVNSLTNMSSPHTPNSTPIGQPKESAQSGADPQIGPRDDPSNADIMCCLKGLESKLNNMDRRLSKLEKLDQRIDRFEAEMKKLWVHVNDQNKKIDERMSRVEEKVETSDFAMGLVNDKVIQIEKERNELRQDVVYLQSQSMRNNLIFGNIPETEQQEDTEKVVRNFLVDKMKIAQGLVDEMKFERVHRMGTKQSGYSGRKIVAKFNLFKERELVRKQSKALKGTDYYVHEQFPKEVTDKRRSLLPQLKDARKAGKAAWLAYDTLYIDGRPVKAQR